jgi:myo-inositol-1-phosphate synthase
VLPLSNPNVRYSGDFIESRFQYEKNHVELSGAGSSGEDGAAAGSAESITITPQTHEYSFRTRRHVPRVGVMLVGWGGNNGSTVTAAIHANKHNITWHRKDGVQKPNYYGSLTQATTIRVGSNAAGKCTFLSVASCPC